MTWIDILNYQPFGGFRIIHIIMLIFLFGIALLEWRNHTNEKNRKKYKKRY